MAGMDENQENQSERSPDAGLRHDHKLEPVNQMCFAAHHTAVTRVIIPTILASYTFCYAIIPNTQGLILHLKPQVVVSLKSTTPTLICPTLIKVHH